MDNHTAFEQAYKKGYEGGYEDGKRDAVAHGHWEKLKPGDILYWRCSCCKNVHFLEEPNAVYCPGCGARMDAKDGET